MKKRLICMLLLVCLLSSVLCACGEKKEITANDAIDIVMEDLGDSAAYADTPHVHTGTYNNEDCYNVYITVSDMSWMYIISMDGDIITKGPSSHSH